LLVRFTRYAAKIENTILWGDDEPIPWYLTRSTVAKRYSELAIDFANLVVISCRPRLHPGFQKYKTLRVIDN
jgi:hypothetical protein